MASVLITGTSKGIGFEAALAFARAGHTVYATMRSPAKSPLLAEAAASENLQPGIIDTSMARRIGEPAAGSPYGQTVRFNALFANALQTPVPPALVAAKILEVAQSGTWTMRHPVGPDAIPILQFRSQMTDEEWVDINAGDDATFFARLSQIGAEK